MKLLPYILFEKCIYILAPEMAAPGNQHCASCIGTLSFTKKRNGSSTDCCWFVSSLFSALFLLGSFFALALFCAASTSDSVAGSTAHEINPFCSSKYLAVADRKAFPQKTTQSLKTEPRIKTENNIGYIFCQVHM